MRSVDASRDSSNHQVLKTELNDRVLWWDGTNEVRPEAVPELLLLGVHPSRVRVTELNEDIQKFNQLSDDFVINVGKTSNDELTREWLVPQRYQTMDLRDFIHHRLTERYPNDPKYVTRTNEELVEIEKRGLGMSFKTLVFILDELKKNNQVWGVGRGSSCASLVLHLIGIHEVDPVKYGIPASEFFHD